jgi:hypothetical protein
MKSELPIGWSAHHLFNGICWAGTAVSFMVNLVSVHYILLSSLSPQAES